jgi:ABC-type sugar transport system substrate-binding protein
MVQARDHDPEEAMTQRSTARAQAGFEKARIRITPDDEIASADSAARRDKPQADLVRQAAARKPQALIVEPEVPPSPDLARAVSEALAAKVPVVVLGRPIPGVEKRPGAAPLVVVGPPSFADSARKLVQLAIRNARNAKLNPEGGALLLVAPASDRFVEERVAAVRDALKAEKIAAVDELLIPNQPGEGAEILRKRLLADPKPSLVFTVDFTGSSASNSASDIAEKRPFIPAGYTSDESLPRMAVHGEFAAIAEFSPTRLIQRTISVAAAVAQGRSMKEKEELAVSIKESQHNAGAPHIQAKRKASMAERARQANE